MAERKVSDDASEIMEAIGNTPTVVMLKLDCPWTPAQAEAAWNEKRKVWVGFGEQQLEMEVVAWSRDEDDASSTLTVSGEMMVDFGEPPAVE